MATDGIGGTNGAATTLEGCFGRYLRVLARSRRADVLAGFGAALGGLLFAALGWTLFLWCEQVGVSSPDYWAMREGAFAAAGVAPPLLLLGATTVLLADRRLDTRGVAGLAWLSFLLCVAAVTAFLVTYPGAWNVVGSPDYSVAGGSVYGVGIAGLLAAAGAGVGCRCAD